jgi:cyclophilin family peptidyl-prolyl cis-trans isomerase
MAFFTTCRAGAVMDTFIAFGSMQRLAAVLAASTLLAACGGGAAGLGGGNGAPSVSSIVAETTQYGRNMQVTVTGGGLLEGVRLDGEGACTNETAVAGGSDTTQRFTCRVATIGSLTVRVRTTTGGRELASVRVTIPNPQVSVRVTQAANGNLPARTGTFVLELDPVAAPQTVNNFLNYVNGGFYTNTIFHRVVRDFVAQGGGYSNVPAVKPPTAAAIPSEANNGLRNLRYSVAMARGEDANSATSQFFINLVDNPTLDFGSADNPAGFAVFGRVVTGQEVVDEIGRVETRPNLALELPDLPVTNVVIAAATQTR